MPSPISSARRPSTLVLRLGVVAALAGLLAACGTSVSGTGTVQPSASAGAPSSSGSLPAQTPAQFVSCDNLLNLKGIPLPKDRKDKITFSCARVDVPLDYSNASGKTIPLELIKVHSSDHTSSVGSLLVNPGGPGASGIELAAGLSTEMSMKVLNKFDLIGFDPRGVGLSSAISCISNKQKDVLNGTNNDVRTADGFARAKALAADVAQRCSNVYGADLAQYNTVNTARDMDRIRQAVGDDQMNYLGFSYGTELGAQYAHLFPNTIRVAVLDGAVNPLTDEITSFANQLGGFEGAFDQFAADCATRASCRLLGDPRQVVNDLVKQADSSPMKSSKQGESRTASGAIVLTGVLEALYSKSEWRDLESALALGQQGDAKGLFALADRYNQRYSDGTYSNISDANTTIGCNDSKPGPTDETIRSTAATWAAKYPMFGTWAAQSLFSCQSWQPVRTPPPLPTAPTAHKVLVIGNLHDPATPYQGAKDLAKTMGNTELLSWDGEGHTSYLQGSSCVDNYVNDYLISGTLPPANTTCPK